MTKFNELPKNVQEEIKGTLRAYDSVNVWYENGKYSFGDVIKAEYAPDRRFIGTYKKEDIYTETEQIENYINEFHEFPRNYKGKRDYAMLNKMDTDRKCRPIGNGKLEDCSWHGKVNENGNFELIGKRVTVFYLS